MIYLQCIIHFVIKREQGPLEEQCYLYWKATLYKEDWNK